MKNREDIRLTPFALALGFSTRIGKSSLKLSPEDFVDTTPSDTLSFVLDD